MTPVEYIEKSGVPESNWPTFRSWFKWFNDIKLVGVVKDGEEVVGVALARCTNSKSPDHYDHNEFGENVFVDLTVTSTDGITTDRSRNAMRCLLTILWDRFGPRRRISFKRNGTFRDYDYMNFMQKALA